MVIKNEDYINTFKNRRPMWFELVLFKDVWRRICLHCRYARSWMNPSPPCCTTVAANSPGIVSPLRGYSTSLQSFLCFRSAALSWGGLTRSVTTSAVPGVLVVYQWTGLKGWTKRISCRHWRNSQFFVRLETVSLLYRHHWCASVAFWLWSIVNSFIIS